MPRAQREHWFIDRLLIPDLVEFHARNAVCDGRLKVECRAAHGGPRPDLRERVAPINRFVCCVVVRSAPVSVLNPQPFEDGLVYRTHRRTYGRIKQEKYRVCVCCWLRGRIIEQEIAEVSRVRVDSSEPEHRNIVRKHPQHGPEAGIAFDPKRADFAQCDAGRYLIAASRWVRYVHALPLNVVESSLEYCGIGS